MLGGEPVARDEALLLQRSGHPNEHHALKLVMQATFVQQRHVVQNVRCACRLVGRKFRLRLGLHGGMGDGLEFATQVGVGKHLGA